MTRKQWLHIAKQLVQKGLLEQSNDVFRVLSLTAQGMVVLKNREPILGILPQAETASTVKQKQGEVEYDRDLFAILRAKRKDLAEAANVPPYVIFSDRTLVEIAAYFPATEENLRRINGIGQVKFERYGQLLIDLVQEFCEARGVRANLSQMSRKAKLHRRNEGKPRGVIVGEAYNDGQSVSDLMEKFGVQRGTILNYLAAYAQDGNLLRPGEDFLSMVDVPVENKAAALRAFEQLGTKYLKPVFEQLGGTVTYDDLKILRLYFLSNHK